MNPQTLLTLVPPALGHAFREWRDSLQLSRGALARAIGCSEQKIEAIEAKGQRLGPSVAAKLRAYLAGVQDTESRFRGLEARVAELERRIAPIVP